jgi:predicted RNA-binding Zn-ribbon protein involved in translation (DUF1610 family)
MMDAVRTYGRESVLETPQSGRGDYLGGPGSRPKRSKPSGTPQYEFDETTGKYQCPDCEYQGKSVSGVGTHRARKHGEPIRCEPCGQDFTSQVNYEAHLRMSLAHGGKLQGGAAQRSEEKERMTSEAERREAERVERVDPPRALSMSTGREPRPVVP